MIKVYIKGLKNTPKISKKKLKSITLKVIELESRGINHGHHKDYEIGVTLVDDNYIRKLNKKYRNVKSSTDVLAFPIEVISANQKPKNLFLGDIYISVDRATQQVQKKENLETEVCRLLIHGILHLLGYDHSKLMFKKQEHYLNLVLCNL